MANIKIDDVKITPQPVITGEKFLISMSVIETIYVSESTLYLANGLANVNEETLFLETESLADVRKETLFLGTEGSEGE